MRSTTAAALIEKGELAVPVLVFLLERNAMLARIVAYFANLLRPKRSAIRGPVPDEKNPSRNCYRWADEDQEF
ncbi:hypothetical protein NCG89_14880 [Spongiibacter taiwanensis]|uniref:hypothetical protein n=1 Tax=Spongiibacter taiwanensis TaxID=1748242 RepID=UPI002035B93C|nr:hypothetical protein [Spongiibacter taiwanensis]USA42816.1 hypothetical protein NCG89_14880 [Spongiibacter taiwanensis]